MGSYEADNCIYYIFETREWNTLMLSNINLFRKNILSHHTYINRNFRCSAPSLNIQRRCKLSCHLIHSLDVSFLPPYSLPWCILWVKLPPYWLHWCILWVQLPPYWLHWCILWVQLPPYWLHWCKLFVKLPPYWLHWCKLFVKLPPYWLHWCIPWVKLPPHWLHWCILSLYCNIIKLLPG